MSATKKHNGGKNRGPQSRKHSRLGSRADTDRPRAWLTAIIHSVVGVPLQFTGQLTTTARNR